MSFGVAYGWWNPRQNNHMSLDQSDQELGTQLVYDERRSGGYNLVSIGRHRKGAQDIMGHVESGLPADQGELASVLAIPDPDFRSRIQGHLRTIAKGNHSPLAC